MIIKSQQEIEKLATKKQNFQFSFLWKNKKQYDCFVSKKMYKFEANKYWYNIEIKDNEEIIFSKWNIKTKNEAKELLYKKMYNLGFKGGENIEIKEISLVVDDNIKKVEEEENQMYNTWAEEEEAKKMYNILVKERDGLKKTCDKIFSTIEKKEKESSFFWKFSREARRLNKEYDQKILEYAITNLRARMHKEMDETWLSPWDTSYYQKIWRLKRKLEKKSKWMKWRIF